jgi:hypothetical protein
MAARKARLIEKGKFQMDIQQIIDQVSAVVADAPRR